MGYITNEDRDGILYFYHVFGFESLTYEMIEEILNPSETMTCTTTISGHGYSLFIDETEFQKNIHKLTHWRNK